MSINLVEQAFEALFFTEAGSIIGLLLIIILITVVTYMKKMMVFLTIPITVWFAMLYLDRMDAAGTYVWHFIILMCFAIANLINAGYQFKKGG